MKVKFYGAVGGIVTGSCYMVDTGNSKFLVDCGMFQGSKEVKERNYGDFTFDPEKIDFLLLTHAHIDHSGLIPKLYKMGFKGKVYCTKVTRDLCSVMLPDSGHIQEMEVERKNRKLKRAGRPLLNPIYTAAEASECLHHFDAIDYDSQINISDDVTTRFRDAGHIFGSAIVETWIGTDEKIKIVFSGDIGNTDQPIIEDPIHIEKADYVVMESTYGDRFHCEEEKLDKKEQLRAIIAETSQKGGNLIIPAFAVERTQDLLYHLSRLEEEDKLYGMKIYMDSPLAISATEIFCKYPEYYDEEAQKLRRDYNGTCPIIPRTLNIAKTTEESIALNSIKSGAIIISASGMCDAGRIKHHLKHNLWRPECTVLFTGYQAPGTLGRRLLEGAKKVRIHGEEVNVKADIVDVKGFSAHADLTGLINWVKGFEKKPEKIFVTHGEEKSSQNLAQKIEKETGIEAVVPQLFDEVDLSNKELRHVQTDAEVNIGTVWELYARLQRVLGDRIQNNINRGEIQEAVDFLKQEIKNTEKGFIKTSS